MRLTTKNYTQDYHAFGSVMAGRSFSNANYRFGFNTQERDIELGADIFTAEFWEYDSRLGRRWNVDPVFLEHFSSYGVLLNCPILYNDIHGDVVEPTTSKSGRNVTGSNLTANIQFRFDPADPVLGGNVVAQNAYIANTMANINAQFNGLTYTNKDGSSASITTNFTSTNLGNAGFGTDIKNAGSAANTTVVDVGQTSTDPNDAGFQTSYSDGKGYMFLNSGIGGQDGAHEFGHILGLSDRYTEIASYTTEVSNSQSVWKLNGGRETIPLALNEIGYNCGTNLMSSSQNGTGSLTNKQIGIIVKNRNEKRHNKNVNDLYLIPVNVTNNISCVSSNRKNLFTYSFGGFDNENLPIYNGGQGGRFPFLRVINNNIVTDINTRALSFPLNTPAAILKAASFKRQ